MSSFPILPGFRLPPDPPAVASPWEKDNARALRRLALALAAVGLLWRCTRYLLRFPVWGDEAMLLVNYFSRDFADLFGPIDNCQIAPLLYHVAALASVRTLGSGELAVRLPSFLACVGSLGLFWRLARLTLPPLGRCLAVGILAVSIWPATMGSLTKPYAFDLFFSLALLVPAVSWLRRPDRLAPLAALAAVVPVVVCSSYPAVFVAGGVGAVLLPEVARQRRPAVWVLFALFGVLLSGGFVGHYLFVARPHLASTTVQVTTATGMEQYWKAGFPPAGAVALLRWFVLAHTGQVAAYPLGSANGGSGLTTLLGVVGMVVLWRRGQRRLVLLMGAVFGLWLIASVLHKYPYGASCRLAQHVAPFYCLFAGLGLAVVIQRFGTVRPWRATLAVAGVLAAIGVGGTVRDCLRPYRDLEALWARSLVDDLAARSGDDPVLVLQNAGNISPYASTGGVNPIFHWQLGRLGDRVRWMHQIDWPAVARTESSVWVVTTTLPIDERAIVATLLKAPGRTWRCVERKPSILFPEDPREGFQHCRIYHWVCDD